MARPSVFDRQVVLEQAMDWFWSHGYGQTGVRDIVGAAGCATTSLYSAFGNKDGLFAAVVDHYVETQLRPALDDIGSKGSGIDAIAALFDAIRSGGAEDRGCFLVNCLIELQDRSVVGIEEIEAGLSLIRDFIRDAIVQGRLDGVVDAETDIELQVGIIYSAVLALRVMLRFKAQTAALDMLINDVMYSLRRSKDRLASPKEIQERENDSGQ